MTGEILKTTLANGLLVLLKEIHTAPLASTWLWYRVGSRNEVPGITGASHWVEHMQFRGTPRYPSGVLDKTVARIGGYWNAMTSMDWTTYFLTLPIAHADLALDVESDRMANSLFTLEDVEAERTVIISERQGNENSPFFLVGEELQAAAYRVHSYHHDVIGDLADLHTIQREDLYQHYRRYYVPNNAVLSMAGDFDAQQMLTRVEHYFGGLQAVPVAARPTRREPPQSGERHLTVEGPGETRFTDMGYHIPGGDHPDFMPLVALSNLLTGPNNMNMFGDGGLSNKTSRLYQALVDRDLSVSVSGGVQATIDPYLYTIMAIAHPARSIDEIIAALDVEIQRIQETPPTQAELDIAVKQSRAMFAFGSESITNQAYWMGYAEMFADVSWFTSFLDRLKQVTPEDVQRAAQTYLLPKNRVRGDYYPTGAGELDGELDDFVEED